MFYDERNRVSVELSLVPQNSENVSDKFIVLMSQLSSYFNCSYLSVDTKGYSVLRKNVFPDRLAVGWMLYTPHVVMPDLITEAARIVPVVDGTKQKGTIIISTEEIFDGNNKEHIGKANDIEIRLLDLGLLPLMTEL
ncbi:TPA: immunity 52 family protein [Enterobacter cloacae]|nr:immunity 52 family protein [Enterobacter cloacae]HDC4683160.1 immunity 52 family protein [Enterobacter cloacae]